MAYKNKLRLAKIANWKKKKNITQNLRIIVIMKHSQESNKTEVL